MKKLLLICLFFSTASYAELNCKKQLKIGVALNLSGSVALATGAAGRNSVMLADEIFDADNCVEFVFEDTQMDPKTTINIVNKLIHKDKVDGLIVLGTPTSIVAAEIAERNKIFMIGLSILPRVVQDKKFVMKHWCSADKLNQAVLAESERRKYKTVATVSSQNDATLLLRDLYKKSTINPVLDEEFSKDNFDFTTVVTKIKSKNPDAVYNLLFPPQAAPFMKELRGKGYSGEVFGVHNIEDPHEIASSDMAMNGVWFVNSDDSSGDIQYPELYFRHYQQKTTFGGANAFDVAKMFIQSAYQDMTIVDYMHSLKNFNGAFGRYNATSANDFDFIPVIKKVADGEIKKAD